jgi:hypothetical protein
MELFYPVMLLIFHTLFIFGYMGYRRYSAVMQKKADPEYYKLYVGEEPAELRVVSRHVSNLLETPPIFYLGVIIAFVTGQTGTALLVLAWCYVALRLVHSAVHLGANVVLWRFRVFVLSVFVMMAFFAVITYGLFTTS